MQWAMHKKGLFALSMLCSGLLLPMDGLPDDQPPKDSQTVATAETTSANEDPLAQRQFQDLLAVMEETTSLATKTRLNADFVPGMVTVLRGEDLELRGIHTLKEAMNLVPGIIENESNYTISVRGVGNWSTGKLRLLVNDLPFTETLTAGSTAIYSMPVEMIDRIEVIRGPGSAVHGEYAFSGVVNVITHQQGRRVFAGYGSFNTVAGGGRYAISQGDWYGNINLAGWDSDGTPAWVEKDTLAGLAPFGMDKISFAPGYTNERIRSDIAIMKLGYKKTSLTAQFTQVANGDGMGLLNMLPAQDKRLTTENRNQNVEIRHEFDLMSRLPVTLKAGYADYMLDIDRTYFAPPGFNQQRADPAADGSMVASTHAMEKKFYTGIFGDWKGWDRHILSMGVDWASMGLGDVRTLSNVNPMTGAATSAMLSWGPQYDWVLEDPGQRRILGLLFQEQWQASDTLSATLGLRHDRYSDVGESLAPRLALVYHPAGNHIFKAQYGTAFRPPSFMELYSNNIVMRSNPDIKPETIKTIDLGYIYRDEESVGRLTLFHSELRDMIDLTPGATGNTQRFANVADVDLNGVELELEKKLTSNLKLDANVSYVTTRDKATRHELPGTSNWTGNLGMIYQPLPDYSLALQTHYRGRCNRAINDPRDKLAGGGTVNLTGTIANLITPGLTFRAGIKNLFDADMREPKPDIVKDYEALGIPPFPAYPNDYQRPGLGLWGRLAYEF
ncbi:MAG: TonB-dependent receptor [Magnetococcus sp. DMHC-1]